MANLYEGGGYQGTTPVEKHMLPKKVQSGVMRTGREYNQRGGDPVANELNDLDLVDSIRKSLRHLSDDVEKLVDRQNKRLWSLNRRLGELESTVLELKRQMAKEQSDD